MRDRSLDEFESLFEKASIPVLDIADVPLTRIAAVLKDDPLDTTLLDLAGYLKDRFQSEVQVHWPQAMTGDRVHEILGDRGLAALDAPFGSTAELVGQVSIGRSQLVLLHEPESEARRFIDLDALVTGTKPPILIVRHLIPTPADVFKNVLHALTGNFRQTQNFAYSFTLTDDDGKLLLLHVIDRGDIEDVRDALNVSLSIAEESGDDLLEDLARHGERYLRGVVAAGRARALDVSYRLAVGHIGETVRRALSTGKYSMLVVGSHQEGHSQVSAEDYQLMHRIRDIPVLAL